MSFDSRYNVFVDAVSGDDGFDASFEAPVRSLARAKQIAAQKISAADRDVTVYLREGTYYLTETLVFDGADGGSDKARVIWTSFPSERTVVSGGVKINGWKLHDPAKNIWKAPAHCLDSRDFFVNGRRAVRARSAGSVTAVELNDQGVVISDKSVALFKAPHDLELVLKNYWNQPRITAAAAESTEEGTLITLKQPGWRTYMETASLGGAPACVEQVDYIENAYELLDAEGEWYLDKAVDTIYYIPRAGESMDSIDAVLGALEHLFYLNGSADEPINNLTVSNITFSHTTWLQASSEAGLLTVQANFYKRRNTRENTRWDERNWVEPSFAVYGRFLNSVTFTNNAFVNIGAGGLSLGRATTQARITRNYFADCGATALALGGYKALDRHPERSGGSSGLSSDNIISDNEITDAGAHYRAGCGIVVGYVANTVVEHNTVKNMPYTAISFGWGWAWGGAELPNKLTGNRIRNNYIENTMNVLFDGGGIYILGRMDGLVVENNYVSRVNNDFGAIYLDNGCQGFTVTNNVIDRAHRNYIYKGDRHTIKDNYCQKSLAEPDLPMPELCDGSDPKIIFENNYLWDDEKVRRIKENAGVRG